MTLPTSCPKPERTPKKAPSPLPRSSRPPRTAPPKARNAARKKREFARTMHSVERVKFVQSRPCVVSNDHCRYYEGHSVNAHVVDDGSKGGARKSGYRCVTEMCDYHHYLLDNVIRRPEFEQRHGIDLQACCDRTEADWLEHSGASLCSHCGSHVSVCGERMCRGAA